MSMPNTDANEQKLVRLGAGYTQIAMGEDERQKAVAAAHWRTLSPHEWTWSSDDQARMALYVLWAAQRLEMINVLASGLPVTAEPS